MGVQPKLGLEECTGSGQAKEEWDGRNRRGEGVNKAKEVVKETGSEGTASCV